MYIFHQKSVSASEFNDMHFVSKKYVHTICITIRCTHNTTHYSTVAGNYLYVIEAETLKSFEQNAVILLAHVLESLK